MTIYVKLAAPRPTRFGRMIDLAHPTAQMIELRDIAWGLSGECADASADFTYTLAQRSVILAEALMRETKDAVIALQGLLFFAGKAYRHLNDDIDGRPTWAELDRVIHQAFAMPWPVQYHVTEAISDALLRLRLTEFNRLRMNVSADVAAFERSGVKPLPCSIVYQPRDRRFDRFIATWFALADGADLGVTNAWRAVSRPSGRKV